MSDAALLRAAIVALGIPATRGPTRGQPSATALAKRLGVNPRTVRRWLAEKEALELEPWPREQMRRVVRRATRRSAMLSCRVT